VEVFWTILVIGGLLALMVYGFVEQSKDKAKSKGQLADFLKDIESMGGFEMTRLHKGPSVLLAIDSTSNQIAFATARDSKTTFVAASKIMSVSIYEDERSITHAHRGRQIGAAVVGNALAGSTGAIIGGLGAKAKSTDMVKRVTLRIEIDNPSKPLLDIDFLKSQTLRGGYVHEQTSKEARTWSSLVTAIMRKTEGAVHDGAVAPSQLTDGKLEKLSKLGQLRDSGVLTSEEFDQEKARILTKEQ
jgi:hypothetical protein